MLFHLDRAWAEHLAFLADLREGIHLRALARGTVPLNEFNKEAIRAFGPLLERGGGAVGRDLPDRRDHRRRRRPRGHRPEAPHRDLDVPGAREPVRHDIDRAIGSLARRFRKPVD